MTVLTTRLRELALAITEGKETLLREFTMRVPAEPERDADIVLSTAANRIGALERALKDLLPFVLEEYFPDMATPRYREAVEAAMIAVGQDPYCSNGEHTFIHLKTLPGKGLNYCPTCRKPVKAEVPDSVYEKARAPGFTALRQEAVEAGLPMNGPGETCINCNEWERQNYPAGYGKCGIDGQLYSESCCICIPGKGPVIDQENKEGGPGHE